MKNRARAVIGACFGDEGKGLMTDYFCRQAGEEPIVVRHNGGANAGHTVMTNDHRHVFRHFGSGTLAGARTYLAAGFCVNPALWLPEFSEIEDLRLGIRTRIFVDRDAVVTTPFDMMNNQRLEEARGENRHGSCGVGIQATCVRSENPALRLIAVDLDRPTYLRDRVAKIAQTYCYDLADERTEAIFETFIKDCYAMMTKINLCDERVLVDHPGEIIFEGAQGLLLDSENQEFFPHLTYSRTGLTNVLDYAYLAGLNHIDVTYVTRTYLTRHGAGPLPGEDQKMSYFDDTNVENQWQGRLRFAPMDRSRVISGITHDLVASLASGVTVNPGIAVTHLDQRLEDFSDWPIRVTHEAQGPRASDVRSVP